MHRFGDKHLPDEFPFRACLRRDELHAEDIFRLLSDFGGCFSQFNAAAFPASPGMNLRLHDELGTAEFPRYCFCRVRSLGDTPGWHADTVSF